MKSKTKKNNAKKNNTKKYGGFYSLNKYEITPVTTSDRTNVIHPKTTGGCNCGKPLFGGKKKNKSSKNKSSKMKK